MVARGCMDSSNLRRSDVILARAEPVQNLCGRRPLQIPETIDYRNMTRLSASAIPKLQRVLTRIGGEVTLRVEQVGVRRSGVSLALDA